MKNMIVPQCSWIFAAVLLGAFACQDGGGGFGITDQDSGPDTDSDSDSDADD